MHRLKKTVSDSHGFTLIETIIVVVILSIMALAVVPRMTTFFSSERENLAILTGTIVAAFDDSFLNSRTNYLAIHLHGPGDEFSDSDNAAVKEIFSRRNGISVLNLKDGNFVESERRILKHRDYPESFMLEEVVLSSGEIMHSGSVLIPFYPQGYSDNAIIHVLINNEDRWSVILHKYIKEPEVRKDYITFENQEVM